MKLGKADETHDDEEYDKLVVECKEHYALLKRVSAAIIVHATAVNAATSSGSALAIVSRGFARPAARSKSRAARGAR